MKQPTLTPRDQTVGRPGHDPGTYGLKEQVNGSDENQEYAFYAANLDDERAEYNPSMHVPAPSRDVGAGLEAALVRALEAAATAGRFDVVKQLAGELAARRRA
jgi:hypothetical protein